MKTPTIEFYKDAAEEHRWRLKHGNGKILASSGEGFSRKAGARRNLKAVRAALAAAVLGLCLMLTGFKAQAQAVTETNSSGGVTTINPLPQVSPAYRSLAQEVWNDYLFSTNSAILVAGGVKLTDTHIKIAAVDYVYNLNDNAGLIIGWDYIWGSKTNGSVANALRGGLNLKTEIQPFQVFGITNIVARPFAAELVSTVLSGPNTGQAGLVSVVGCDFDLWKFKAGTLHGGGMYENRTAQGWASGNYALIHLAFTLNHIKAGGKPW